MKLSKIVLICFVCLALLVVFVLMRSNRVVQSKRNVGTTRVDISFDIESPIEVKLRYEPGENDPARTKTISSDHLKQELLEIFQDAVRDDSPSKMAPFANIMFTNKEGSEKLICTYGLDGDTKLYFSIQNQGRYGGLSEYCYCGKGSFVAFHGLLKELFPNVDIPDFSKL